MVSFDARIEPSPRHRVIDIATAREVITAMAPRLVADLDAQRPDIRRKPPVPQVPDLDIEPSNTVGSPSL